MKNAPLVGKRAPREQRRCIFCGGTPISKEHIFPKWMRDYLPAPTSSTGGTHHMVNFSLRDPDGRLYKLIPDRRGPLTLKGDHRSRGLRVVCKKCNEDWMSTLQRLAKPILEPMLLGNIGICSPEEKKIISSWATMLTMVYEFADERTISISMEDRRQFKENQKPPKNFFIWLGKFSGQTQNAGIWHRGFAIIKDCDAGNFTSKKCNMQTTVFAVGCCIFQITSIPQEAIASSTAYKLRRSGLLLGFRRILPSASLNSKRKLPNTKIFVDSDFEKIMDRTTSDLTDF
jgi:hypothetical protein